MRWILPSTWISRCLFATLLAMACALPASTAKRLEAGAFSAASAGQSLPDSWQPLTFRRIERETAYTLVEEGDTVVVQADSEQSASGLTRAITIDPKQYPILQWRWKVNNILQHGDVSRKDGDDYPARIYISFAFDPDRASYLEKLKYHAARLLFGPEVPYRAISYIWESHRLPGTMVPNPYTDRVMMFVVRGGNEYVQQWVSETRNVYEDYKLAFGTEPTMISGVAIMTDTDNTQESATAWYGDIVFSEE